MKAINHETFCFICDLWGIERRAQHIGVFRDGEQVPICDSCKASGFKTIEATVMDTRGEDESWAVFGTQGSSRRKFQTSGISKTATLNKVICDFITQGITITHILNSEDGEVREITGNELREYVIDAMS